MTRSLRRRAGRGRAPWIGASSSRGELVSSCPTASYGSTTCSLATPRSLSGHREPTIEGPGGPLQVRPRNATQYQGNTGPAGRAGPSPLLIFFSLLVFLQRGEEVQEVPEVPDVLDLTSESKRGPVPDLLDLGGHGRAHIHIVFASCDRWARQARGGAGHRTGRS